jgi:hypothetical protein
VGSDAVSTTPCARTIRLRIGPHRTGVWLDAVGRGAPDVDLDLGWGHVVPGPFASTPPRPAELERAIEFVEDQVMPLARIIPRGPVLCVGCEGLEAPELARVVRGALRERGPSVFGLPHIEAAFARLAAIAEGAPAGDDESLARPQVAAALLIVRELMHHAGLQEVTLA